jgi:hypothetical protein
MKFIHSLALASLLVSSASAVTLDFSAADTGWYDSFGFHDTANTNYATGQSFDLTRSFFVFDTLPLFGGTITSATLTLANPAFGYDSPDASETISFYAFGGSIASLLDGSAGLGAFDDLGDGTVYGGGTLTASDNGTSLTFTLNADFLTALQAAGGGSIAIGGALTSLDPLNFSFNELVFGFSDGSASAPKLSVEVSPAASVPDTAATAGLLGLAFAGIAALARRFCVAPAVQA